MARTKQIGMTESIFIDGGFDPTGYESRVSKTGMPPMLRACDHHKKKHLPYVVWNEWADSLEKQGITQSQCDICKHWLYPEEI